jgi:Mor family transcriptional regulator
MIHGVAVPIGCIVMHTCDNPSCVRPEHLIVATQRDNIKDKVNKNRQAVGENIGLSKLTESIVLEIRSFYPALSIRKLSRKYNTCENNVRAIIKRETWKHI